MATATGLWTNEEINELHLSAGYEEEVAETKSGSLVDDWGAPPFTILDARQGYWKTRKKEWLALGICSELGRGRKLGATPPNIEAIIPGYYHKKEQGISHEEIVAAYTGEGIERAGISVFDPVLCELVYRWFCPPGGSVLDPFAGGSVRGIVAAKSGLDYMGIDLSAQQMKANEKQAQQILGASDPRPTWIIGDSANIPRLAGHRQVDFMFSCPPYHDLEVYGNEPGELSAMDWPTFIAAYHRIIVAAVDRLKNNRFACFVVGELRNKRGFYKGFIGETINAFEAAGLQLYNEAIFITPAGSLPIRIGRQFAAGRKLGKTHQNVLIFYKGDPSNISEHFPREVKLADLDDTNA